MAAQDHGSIIALDVGEKRIGVARASLAARLPEPLGALVNDAQVWDKLAKFCQKNSVVRVVVGLPRGLDGQDSAQTRYAQNFARSAKQRLGLPVELQDEALTSAKAKAELNARGRPYKKGDIDALAATYILEDFLKQRGDKIDPVSPPPSKTNQKGRCIPRRLKWLTLGLVILIIAAMALVHFEYDKKLKPVSSSHQVSYITIAPGSSVKGIAGQLSGAGLIRSTVAFEGYVSSHDERDQLQAGTYSLMPSQSTPQIVAVLVAGKIATNLVTIIPGQRLDQVRENFVKAGFKSKAVDAALEADQYRKGFPALADNPPSAGLEGFLYPDSFQKTATTDPRQIVEESLTEMQQHLNVQLRNAFAKEGLTTYQAVTLASMVEQEVAKPADRAQVAQVFLTRLHKGMSLGSDATARYGAAKNGQAPNTDYDSAYNTLLHKGLPPGPIGAISDSSLAAVASPASSSWLYFVSGDDGTTHFSKTLKEHEALVKQYCHKQCASATP